VDEELLLVPGPTPVAAEVSAASARPLVNHRGPHFRALFRRVQEGLRFAFQTEHEVLVFPSAGTGMLEAAIVNCFSPGDRVLVGAMGAFGQRFAEVARAFGLTVDVVEGEWGRSLAPETVAAALRPDTRGVLVTFNETSTGALLDLAGVAAAVRRRSDALLVVDAVSGLGGADLRMDAWGCDVVLTASQKALGVPPGLGLCAVGPRAAAACERARLPRFYWDWRPYLRDAAHGETPYTPAVGLWYGLDAALARLRAEGLQAAFARHRALAATVRAGFAAVGLPPLAPDAEASPTVTCLVGAEAGRLVGELQRRGIAVGGGMGPLRGKALRVGHMGSVTRDDLLRLLDAVDDILGTGGRAREAV
jgi:aspartate aminotransferase-like enzyme